MSIATRIESIEEHIGNAYDELQGLGADLTGIDKNIENISMVLDDIYDSMPQVSGEGTSLTLDDTRVGKIKSTLKGNTSQTTYSGKNIIKNTGVNQTINGITYVVNNDGSVKVSGTASARSEFYLYNNNTVTLPISSGISYKNTTNAIVILNTNDGYKVFQANGTTSSGSATQITQAYLRIESGTTVNETLYPMISEQGGTYEPYVGGTPSPNPSYPQPVNVVSGDNTITISNQGGTDSNTYNIDLPVENLLDLTSLNPNQVGQQVSNIQENSFIMSGTAVWGNEYFFYENTNKNTTYTASCKYLSSLARKSGLSIYGTNETTGENLTTINSLLVDIPANVETPVTNTFNSGNYDYIVFRYWNNATATALSSRVDLYVKEVQLEKGSKQNNFTPYGTTPIELCKIGNYQDYFYKDSGKWYLHKEIGKVVLNGSEAWTKSSNTNVNRYYIPGTFINTILNISTIDLISDYFTCITPTQSDAYNVGLSKLNNTSIMVNFSLSDTSFDTLQKFKTWLSSHNVVVYYVLATTTTIEVEYQPLIDQLNLLEKAMSKDGQTNISQVNNDLPFIISASALKEWSV